ncbi:MAG: hypothetical protein AAB909_03085 [Patescibacteria group bacterium]
MGAGEDLNNPRVEAGRWLGKSESELKLEIDGPLTQKGWSREQVSAISNAIVKDSKKNEGVYYRQGMDWVDRHGIVQKFSKNERLQLDRQTAMDKGEFVDRAVKRYLSVRQEFANAWTRTEHDASFGPMQIVNRSEFAKNLLVGVAIARERVPANETSPVLHGMRVASEFARLIPPKLVLEQPETI